MKIVMLVYDVARKPLGNRTGYEAIALSEAGYEIRALTLEWDGGPAHEFHGGISIENVRVPLLNYNRKLRRFLCLPVIYYRLISRLLQEQYLVVYCQHPFLLPLAIFAGKVKGAKIVYDAYEMYSVQWSARLKCAAGYIRHIIEGIENLLVRRADYVLTVDSRDGVLAGRYGKVAKVEVLYNVPELTKEISNTSYKRRMSEIAEKYEGYRVIIYVGGVSYAKGAMQLIESTHVVKKDIPNVKLLVAGKFTDDSGQQIEKYVKKHELDDNYEFLGWLSHEDMSLYLKVAVIGVALHQPTRLYMLYPAKGTGRKFFTYMESGLPIVGPEFAEVGQVVREENCGILVDTTKPEDIAEAIVYLLNHTNEAKALGDNGRRAVEEKYNLAIEKKKVIRVFETLCDTRSRSCRGEI